MLFNAVAYSYQMYTPDVYRYYGVYESGRHRNHAMYKSGTEHNHQAPTKYYCFIPDNSDTGYLLEKSPFGFVGYVWQNDGYMLMERIRCHRTYDTYPVVKSFSEARNFVD